jgi:phage uncharacterized protein (putative large terminase), C-terminal domain
MNGAVLGRTIEAINGKIAERPYDAGAYEDLLSVYKAEMDECGDRGTALYAGDGQVGYVRADADWHEANRGLRDRIVEVTGELVRDGRYREVERFNIAYRRSLLMDARVDFDAYMLYVESDRDPERRFWLPRRGILRPVADEMVRMVDGDLRLLSISLPPGVGKTTLAIFLLTWIGGRWPDEYSVVFSHDGEILKGMYGEILRIINPDGEYLWRDVFPDVPLVSTNAKDMRIDLGHGSRFETVQFCSLGSEAAGKVRASKLIYCDDLVGSIEQAMSKERLDKLWTQYTTDIQQRGTGDYRELHIATRWSVWDVIGRLERQEEDAPTGRARFIAVPALNERDESNFDFPGIANKFTTEKYRRLRESMDEVNWRALYMNEPIEREGQLYSEEELRRYFELPKGEPDAVIGVCDTKAKGSDYCVLPVAYKYGEDYYIADAVCDNNADTGVLEEKMARILADRNVQVCQFESNSAGWSIAEQVQKRVKSFGARCSVSTKPTTANKETKIIVNAPWVKEHCLFRDKSTYTRNSDYGRLIEQMMLYTVAGKNRHDDAPDAMAMLALYAQSFGMAKVRAVERPY